jgi:hypothetical protein
MKTSLVPYLCISAVVGLFGAGCTDRLYDSGETISLIDAGPLGGASGRGAGGSDTNLGGQTGTGNGGGGGAAGDTGTGSGGSDGGTVNMCDETSPLRLTDVANCGHCFTQCYEMNADATCVSGSCQYTCLTGFFDADHDPANGCECMPTNNGVELCDGLDNDCNGVVDDGFDLMSDLNNCGGCNLPCYFPFAASSCDMGLCTQGACLPDFYDRDPATPGCETSCVRTNGGVEICDGVDNDCNGFIDDNVMAATITCKTRGVCAGTLPVCHGSSGYTCTYPSTYQELEDTTKGCDSLDNDCDGQTDEPFAIGKSCIFGTGPCAGPGTWICDNTQAGNRLCSGSLLPSSPEVCDGKDNDCDGKIDELDKLSDANDTLVTFTTAGKTITMFAYEASRVDSTTTNIDSSHRPCSLPGKKAWANITKEEAAASCALIGNGWRLCAGTEWTDACNGAANTTFPYGAAYVGSKCNGYDYLTAADAGAAAPITTGAASGCISNLTPDAGVTLLYDMSGNVKEWVTTTVCANDAGACDGGATAVSYQIRGGAYNTPSFSVNAPDAGPTVSAPGLQCDSLSPAPTDPVRLPSVGFRCCHTGALPQ